MRFALLGSGSEGNALIIEVGQTRLMMDCGFSLSETVSRLARIDLTPEHLDAIVVTHEHGDHISGVARLAKKYALPVYLTHGTLRSQNGAFAGITNITEINSHHAFRIGEIHVQPYPVPHDASEPVQYIFSNGSKRLGVLTDAGCSTPHIEAQLSGCDALILECNHDEDLLANGDYPYSLKQRVGGRFGHLNNHEAAAILSKLDKRKLQCVIAAHLSQKNNSRELAINALSASLSWPPEKIIVATQEHGTDWHEIQ